MKRFSLFLALTCLLALPFGGVFGQSLNLLPGIGNYPGAPDSIDCAAGDVSIQIEMDQSSGNFLTGSTNGIEVSSPDGATWTYDDAVNGGNWNPAIDWSGLYYDGGTFVNPFSLDGMGADTIGFGGFKLFKPGIPDGFVDLAWIIDINVSCADKGKQICVDSTFYPPAGAWLWSTSGGPVNPGWSGGRCWYLAEVPCLNPVISNDPVSLTGDHCNLMTYDFDFTDGDGGGPYTFNLTGPGSIDGAGVWSYAPSLADIGAGLSIDVSVSDASCGTGAAATVNLNFTNVAPSISCPDTIPVGKGNTAQSGASGTSGDCDPISYSITGVNPTPVGTYSIDAVTGVITFNTDLSDAGTSGQTFCFTVEVSDGLDVASCDVCFDVLFTEPYELQIEKTHGTFQGMHELVDVSVNLGSEDAGGFDILIGYDASALNFQSAIEGSIYASCGWEYFTYRYSWNGNCGNQCPSGKTRVVGIAETNNGANHPTCFGLKGETLFTLDFLVSDDRTLECQYVPIRFCWFDCGDNTISSRTGDSLFISRQVIDFDLIGDIADPNHTSYPSYFGAGADCENQQPNKPDPVRFVDFLNGGVDIVCADSIDARGDINLNGLSNEIADAVLFSNYFVYGIGVFTVNMQGQVAASDVNADGLTLSVSDLVYLIRIVIGDANPFPKVTEVAASYVYDARGNLSVDAPMGAAAVVVSGDVSPTLEANNMEMLYNYDAEANVTRVLVYSMEEGQTFSGTFLSDLSGGIVSVEMATYEGAPVAANAVPADFALNQNYPNPFNPSTSISFSLPNAGEYTLSIYNVTGQEVASFTGTSEAGLVELEWSATDMASGIYFYKLVADNFTDTKKMVLLK
ncbi:MAG: T9SS type A sorting domain-containing protein [Candidatus Zixiibacteriota bacterium]